MALVDNAFYVDSAGWTAVTAWATGTVTAVGALRRQNATPTVGNERVFICIVAGTTHATTEPTWVLTRGAKTTDNTVTWQECTGIAAINGDATNTPSWTITATPPGGVKGTAVTLGEVIKRDSGASYKICTTAGTAGSGAEPAFSNTAGVTTNDNSAVWTSLGVVGNFTGNQAPHARLSNALTANWAQAGNTVFIKSSHAETAAAAGSIVGAGTLALPIYGLCHDGGAYPPLAANLTTGASITTTGNNSITQASISLYLYGVKLAAGTGASANSNLSLGSANASWIGLENCILELGSTNGTPSIILGGVNAGAGPKCDFKNVTLKFGATGQFIQMRDANLTWRANGANILAASSSVPTSLFKMGGTSVACGTLGEISGLDLSDLGSGSTIIDAIANDICGAYVVRDCKVNASATLYSAPLAPASFVDFINVDSGTKNYRNERARYAGALTTETTIVLTGGASDGTTPISWKIITTANAKYVLPFECFPITVWNDAVGSAKTLTIQGIWGGGAVPNNDDIWVEVEYLSSSSTPISSLVSDGKATLLTAAAAQDAGSGTWGGSTTKFALAVTFTPQMKGAIIARVKCARATSTFYIDPKITLT